MKIFKREKSNTYFDLPSRDRKKIVNNAVKEANKEQLSLVMDRRVVAGSGCCK